MDKTVPTVLIEKKQNKKTTYDRKDCSRNFDFERNI